MLFPIVTLPYLTRILDKENFGLVIFCQSFAAFLSVIIEYGFNYTATREIAETQDDIKREAKIFRDVTLSKIILSAITLFLAALYLIFVARLPKLTIFYTLILIIAQGFMPIWYFQGKSNMFVVSIMELFSRFFSFAFLIFFIKQSNQGSVYIASLAIIGLLTSLVENTLIFRRVGFEKLDLSFLTTLSSGFSFFLFRVGSILYSSGSMFLLSILVNKPQLALYGGADRVFRAAAGLTGPIGDAFYPRIAATYKVDYEKSKRLTKVASSVLIGGSTVLAILLFILADKIIDLLLGPAYMASKDIFQILVWDIPLIAIGTCLGVFGMLPRRLDKAFSRTVFVAGMFSLGSILLGVPHFGLKWMALTIIFAETIVIFLCIYDLLLYRRKKSE